MVPLRRQILMASFKIADVLVMGITLVLTSLLYSQHLKTISIDQFFSLQVKLIDMVMAIVLVALWHIVFFISGLYRSRRLSNLKREIIDVVKATALGTLVVFLTAELLRVDYIHPYMSAVFFLGTVSMTVLLRTGMRTLLKALRRRGHNLRHILIIGTNRRAIQFASEIETKPGLGYIVAGFVDEHDSRGACQACEAFKRTNYRIVSDVNGLSAYIRKNVVDEVMVALPVKSFYQEIARIINICAEQGVLNRHLPDIFNRTGDKLGLEDIDEQSMMPRNRNETEEWQILIKWIFDKILAISILILLAPLFAIVAIAIKLDSPGPVFFIQKRVGLNKRVFRVFKFRTMSVDAPLMQVNLEAKNEASGPVFKIKNDPRITGLGQFLRKTSIDEFPQLINVLKGEMSIVGPRPLPLRDFDGFDRDWLHRRFSVMPGITCLWQVSGRSNIAFERWMRLDMQYIDQWSLWLDFKILLMTFRAVLSGTGAA